MAIRGPQWRWFNFDRPESIKILPAWVRSTNARSFRAQLDRDGNTIVILSELDRIPDQDEPRLFVAAVKFPDDATYWRALPLIRAACRMPAVSVCRPCAAVPVAREPWSFAKIADAFRDDPVGRDLSLVER